MDALELQGLQDTILTVASLQQWRLDQLGVNKILEAAFPLDSEEVMRILDKYSARSDRPNPTDLIAEFRARDRAAHPTHVEPSPEPTLCEEFVRFCRANRQRRDGVYPSRTTCRIGQCDRVDVLPCNQQPGSGHLPKMCTCVQAAWDAPLTANDWALAKSGDRSVTKPPVEIFASF